jgi:hypothetical protein
MSKRYKRLYILTYTLKGGRAGGHNSLTSESSYRSCSHTPLPPYTSEYEMAEYAMSPHGVTQGVLT